MCSKQQAFELLMDDRRRLVIQAVPHPDLDVPQSFRDTPNLFILNARRNRGNIWSDSEGVHAALSFSCVPYKCFFPWKSINAFVFEEWPPSETESISTSKPKLQVLPGGKNRRSDDGDNNIT